MQRATQSKERTEKATVIELAQTDILGQIAENKGETISGAQLKTILNKYFEDFDDELPEDLSETTITLIAKEEYGGYTNIELSKIYNGKLANQNETKKFTISGFPPWFSTENEYKSGMTWGEYISSDYNVQGFKLVNNYVELSNYGVLCNGIKPILASLKIDENTIYQQKNKITFYIDTGEKVTYGAIERINFKEWIEQYNPESVIVSENLVYYRGIALSNGNYTPLNATTTITDGKTYIRLD